MCHSVLQFELLLVKSRVKKQKKFLHSIHRCLIQPCCEMFSSPTHTPPQSPSLSPRRPWSPGSIRVRPNQGKGRESLRSTYVQA